MSDILCVTSRSLCKGDFLEQLERIAEAKPAGILLREKDLTAEDYTALAKQVMAICEKYQVPCILHTYARAAQALRCQALHLPMRLLEKLPEEARRSFSVLGASCHSVEEAKRAQALGCTYITAGHIFVTQCKAGLAPRGLDFLQAVCQAVTLPVYAIGGIAPENIISVREAGAAGGCVMSGLMRSEDPKALLSQFE